MTNIFRISVLVIAGFILTSCIDMMFAGGRYAGLEAERQIWQQKAFARDVEAQYKLAKLYCCGERPKYDDIKALYWWCEASKGGQSDAMIEIGKMYEGEYSHEGSIISLDYALAYTYYSLADEADNPKAEARRQEILAKLGNDDILQAEKYLAKWPDIPCKIER